jgi:hypothetical protein
MAGIAWWTGERLGWLAGRAAEGLTATAIAAEANRRWRRRPAVTAEGVGKIARAHGISLLARGGRPFSIRNPQSAIRT